jgi:hypothetical protein
VTPAPAVAPFERVNSKVVPAASFVLRKGPSLRDALARYADGVAVDVGLSVSRLPDDLRHAVATRDWRALLEIQIAMAALSGIMAVSLLRAAVVRVDGLWDQPASGEQLITGGAPPALIAEITQAIAQRMVAMQSSAAGEVVN